MKPANGRRGPGRPPGRPPGQAGPGRPAAAARAQDARRPRTGGRTRRGRGSRSNTRADQALALIKQNPGIKVPDIADKMGIRQNYLYRVTAGLEGSVSSGAAAAAFTPPDG